MQRLEKIETRQQQILLISKNKEVLDRARESAAEVKDLTSEMNELQMSFKTASVSASVAMSRTGSVAPDISSVNNDSINGLGEVDENKNGM